MSNFGKATKAAAKMIGKMAMHLVVGTFVAGLSPEIQKLLRGMKYRNFNFSKEERDAFYKSLGQKTTAINRAIRERGIKISTKTISGDEDFIILEFSFLTENNKYKNRAKVSFNEFKIKHLTASQRETADPTKPFYFIIQKNISEKVNDSFLMERDFSVSKTQKWEFSRYEFDIGWCVSDNYKITSFNNSLTKIKDFEGRKKFKQYKCIIPRQFVENVDKTKPPSTTKEMFDDYVIPQFFNIIVENKSSSSADPIPNGILTMKTSELTMFVTKLASEIVKQLKQNTFNQMVPYGTFNISYNSGVNFLQAKISNNLKVGVYRNSTTKIFEVRISHKDHPNTNQLSAVIKFNISKDQASFMVMDNSNNVESEKILRISDTISEILVISPESMAKFVVEEAPPRTSYFTHLGTLKGFLV